MALPEAWLRGPIPGIARELVPLARALEQAEEDLERVVSDLTIEELWTRPGGAASLGFHLRHIAGSTDRLLAYARGAPLTEAQRKAAALEGDPGVPPAAASDLFVNVRAAFGRAMDEMRATAPGRLHEECLVGRAALPLTVFGALFHIAEHVQRHTGQAITTLKILRGIS